MKIYLDKDFKCHVDPIENAIVIETDFFDGKCRTFIEGYRFIPKGQEWTREDGVIFTGEMVTPWADYQFLEAIQAQSDYKKLLIEVEDMQSALEILGVNKE